MKSAMDQMLENKRNSLLGYKTISANKMFDMREVGENQRTHSVTFTSTEAKMEVDIEDNLRNVISMDIVGLSLANPFVTISTMNCCLTISEGTATGTAHYLIIPTGDYSGVELEDNLNKGLVNLFGDARLQFEYDTTLSKFRLFNSDANNTYFVPTATEIASQLSVSGLQNIVGSVWPTLGFAIDSVALKLRSKTARAGAGGTQPVNPAPPTNLYNETELISLPIPEDPSVTHKLSGTISIANGSTTVYGVYTKFTTELAGKTYIKFDNNRFTIASITSDTEMEITGASYATFSGINAFTEEDKASILATYPLTMPYESFGRSALNLYQSGLYETPFSLRNSKKMLYLIATDLETSHHIASAHGKTKRCTALMTLPSGNGNTFPLQANVPMFRRVPQETQVGMAGVMAVIPVVSQQVQLQGFDHLPVDLRSNPIANLKRIRLKLIDQNGELVDMRGRGIICTIQFTMKTHK
mgnify:CR=1 FL=1